MIFLNVIIEFIELSFYFSNSQMDFLIESIPNSILNLISDIFNLICLGGIILRGHAPCNNSNHNNNYYQQILNMHKIDLSCEVIIKNNRNVFIMTLHLN
jgi:hypothetical protein